LPGDFPPRELNERFCGLVSVAARFSWKAEAVPRGINEAPIPADGRLLRHVRLHQEHVAHLKLLVEIAEEVGGDVREEQEKHRAAYRPAADGRDLRGIPAIGRGVSGAIRGTRPGDDLFR
jgi:hypothetical protein